MDIDLENRVYKNNVAIDQTVEGLFISLFTVDDFG